MNCMSEMQTQEKGADVNLLVSKVIKCLLILQLSVQISPPLGSLFWWAWLELLIHSLIFFAHYLFPVIKFNRKHHHVDLYAYCLAISQSSMKSSNLH